MHMEDALDNVKAYLDSNLTSMLTTIETERSVTIPRLVKTDTAFIVTKQLPVMEILPADSEPEYGDADAPLLEHWNYHTIDIMVTAAGVSHKEVEYTLLRYAEALWRLVNDDETLNEKFNRVYLGTADYTLMIETQEDKKIAQTLSQRIICRELDNT